jgi:hypothetical protein
MASTPSVISQFAAAAALAAMLSMPTPVIAAEAASGAAASGPATIKYHASRRARIARYHHHVGPVVSHLGCSGEWCGRQFVLMVGIGF